MNVVTKSSSPSKNNNALSCFMTSLRESHSVAKLQLVCDNPKSTHPHHLQMLACPPPPPQETTPRSAHKLQRWQWDGSLAMSSPNSSLQFENPAGENTSDQTSSSSSTSKETSCQGPQHQGESDRPRLDRKSLIIEQQQQHSSRGQLLASDPPADCSPSSHQVLPQPTPAQQQWFGRSPPSRMGAVSIPMLPVRKPSLRNIFADTISCQ